MLIVAASYCYNSYCYSAERQTSKLQLSDLKSSSNTPESVSWQGSSPLG